MTKCIYPGQTIGIIGGGQLGRMMALAAREAGFKIAVLDPAMDSPCGQVSDIRIVAPYHDEAALHELAEASDVITYEFENVDVKGLQLLEQIGYLPQGAELVRITQNRKYEKDAIKKAGVTVAPYVYGESLDELKQHVDVDKLGDKLIVKTATGGYDGKGQQLIQSEDDWQLVESFFEHSGCVAEAVIPFDKEISVIIHRNVDGEMATLPIGENIHQNHILHETIVPARVSHDVLQKAKDVAMKIADSLELVGTLAIEMFVLEDGSIIVNELAPRPHNSGHYSLEGCTISQFHQHIRAICGWPLRTPELHKGSVMVNVLGQHMERIMNVIPKYPNWSIHLYGKEEAKRNRKMGHVTILTDSIKTTLHEIEQSGIWSE